MLRALALAALCAAVFLAFTDRPQVVAAAVTAEDADVNQDGYVNVLDLVAISKNQTPRADVNRDGAVNSLDMRSVALHFGPLLRDKFKRPYSSTSIWNMPIGSGAKYALAGFQVSTGYYAIVDEDHWVVTSPSDPVREIYNDRGTWAGPRCTGAVSTGLFSAVPESLVVPDVTANSKPNRSAAILQPDGRTIIHLNALARCTAGGPIWGVPHYTNDIYGDGIKGGHGGSGLSSIGGTVRLGELLPGGTIRHALKVNVTCAVYCSAVNGPGGGPGYRWPANTSDQHCGTYACGYGGWNPNVQMGSLLALPSSLTEATIAAPGTNWAPGMETEVGRKLFHAFQDYGAYIVDDAVWNGTVYALHVEDGVTDEVDDYYGISLDGALLGSGGANAAYWRDWHRIWLNLRVISNNSPTSIGGGGTPRVPLAPPIGN